MGFCSWSAALTWGGRPKRRAMVIARPYWPLTSLSRDGADRPEVARQSPLQQVRIGQCEVAPHAPARAPGVTDDEALLALVVPDREHGMAAELLLAGSRHRRLAGRRDFLALEARVDDEPEHEREPVGEAALELAQRRRQPLIENRFVLRRVVVGRLRRLITELADVVLPLRLGRRSLVIYGLHAVSDLGTGIRVDRSLDCTLVVVDEQPGRRKCGLLLLHLIELECRRDCVCRAAPKLPLVVDAGALVSQIDLRRQLSNDHWRRRVHEVTAVGHIWVPAIALNLALHKAPPITVSVCAQRQLPLGVSRRRYPSRLPR